MACATLDLIDLDQPKEGYRRFLSCWVYQSQALTFIVDPGPRSTASHLVSRLKDLGVSRLDYVLLSHIHLDHGGGSAEVLEAFPGSRFYCHESGADHVKDPSRLWSASLKTIGDIARMYQEPTPVPTERFVGPDQLKEQGVEVIPTPGHASHHVCFLYDEILFAGEAIATRMPLSQGRFYLRPATPPRFILESALDSLDRLLDLNPEPRQTAFAHYGLVDGVHPWCRWAWDQLILWVDLVRQLRLESNEDLEGRLFERLSHSDPCFGQGRYDELDPDIQARERFYIRNTIKGIVGYIEAQESAGGPKA